MTLLTRQEKLYNLFKTIIPLFQGTVMKINKNVVFCTWLQILCNPWPSVTHKYHQMLGMFAGKALLGTTVLYILVLLYRCKYYIKPVSRSFVMSKLTAIKKDSRAWNSQTTICPINMNIKYWKYSNSFNVELVVTRSNVLDVRNYYLLTALYM